MILAADRGPYLRPWWLHRNDRLSGDARLIYSAIASLDGYVETRGSLTVDAGRKVHASSTILNGRSAPIYGRRMYETMVFRETASNADEPAVFGTMPRSGGQPRRSCTPGRFRRYQRGRESSAARSDAVGSSSSPRGRHRIRGPSSRATHSARAGRRVPSVLVPIVVGGKRPARQRPRNRLLDERRFKRRRHLLPCTA